MTLPLRFGHQATHYELLGLPTTASPKEIKKRFKQMSKLYHPDIVSLKPEFQKLSEQDQQTNHDNYIRLVESYEVLLDEQKRRSYDQKLNQKSVVATGYTESYKKRGYTRNSGGMYTRTRVYYGHHYDPTVRSRFHGMPNGTGKYDVPHFDYDSHLQRQLKQEERLVEKKMQYFGDELLTHRRFQYVYKQVRKK